MLPKSQRLNLKKDFKWVVSGRRLETSNFRLYLKVGQNSHPLVGIAVSSKVFKKAHDRNRAKRLASGAIQSLYSSLPKSLNLVIMPKQTVLETSVEKLQKELNNVKFSYQPD